jgi:methyl-accepting chemotaxis protein
MGDEDDFGDDGAFQRCWEQKNTQVSEVREQEGWGRLISIYTPIFNSRETMVGIVGCDFDAEELYSAVRSQTVHQIIVALCFLVAGLGIMFLFLRMIFGRIQAIDGILKEIAEGEGDLTKRIKILHHDEIGELGEYFNQPWKK